MKVQSIGTRLTLWYVGLLAATLILLGGSAYTLLAYSLSREVDVALDSVAGTVEDRARAGIETPGLRGMDQVFRRFFGFTPLEPYFEMLDPSGRRRYGTSRQRQLPLSAQAIRNASRGIPTYETLEIEGQRYPIRLLTKPVIVNGRVADLVQVGVSLQRTQETSQRFLLTLAALVPLGLALAGGGGWLLARRALKPVGVMTRAAQRISANHLSERLEESGTGDELDQLARTLNETLERLDESFNQMRQFSADASHELQTPLTVLKGEIEVALRSLRTPEEYRTTLQSALEEVDRLARLVEGLLFLARAETGVLRIDRKPVKVSDLVQAVYDELQVTAKQRELEFRHRIEQPVEVFGDPILLRQLLQNLVQNGVKYTPEGGTVLVKAGIEGNWATLTVSDNGDGVSLAEQARIFQRFYRATTARSDLGGGAGLGLSIVRSIVDAHEGEIDFISRPEEGTTVTVRLPLHKS